jgi:ABC-type multidrug transport system fused ATPase/permease subunit
VSIFVGYVLVTFVRAVVVFVIMLTASSNLHEQMVLGITRAPILFFDSNPVGRIQTRFSKDMATLDLLLPQIWIFASNGIWRAICVFVALMVLQPWVCLVTLIVLVFCVAIFNYTVTAMLQAQRMDSVYRGPINSGITNVVCGVVSIRAYERVPHFRRKFIDDLERSCNVTWTYFSCNRLMALWLDLGVIICLFSSVVMAMLVYVDTIEPAALAFSLQIICDVAQFLSISVRFIAECQNYMTSSQRVVEYAELTPEDDLVKERDLTLLGLDESAL